jgi:hypothetical protein
VTLIALHAVKTAAMNRHNRALHVNEIVLTQLLSFQSKIVPHLSSLRKLSGIPNSESSYRVLDVSRKRGVVIALQRHSWAERDPRLATFREFPSLMENAIEAL